MKQLKMVRHWIDENQLVSVQLLNGQNPIVGRIISYDGDRKSFLVYDDDGKMVHHVLLSEIECIKRSLP